MSINYGYLFITDLLVNWSNRHYILHDTKDLLSTLRYIYNEPFYSCDVYGVSTVYNIIQNTIIKNIPLNNPIKNIYMIEITDKTDISKFNDGIMYLNDNYVYVIFINHDYRDDMSKDIFLKRMIKFRNCIEDIISHDLGFIGITYKKIFEFSIQELYLWYYPFYAITKWIISTAGEIFFDSWKDIFLGYYNMTNLGIPINGSKDSNDRYWESILYLSSILYKLTINLCNKDITLADDIMRELYASNVQVKCKEFYEYIQLERSIVHVPEFKEITEWKVIVKDGKSTTD